jgi:hypothetical protein
MKTLGSIKTPGELAKNIAKNHGTTIEVSTSGKTGNCSVIIKGQPDAVKIAKKEICAALCAQVTVSLLVPGSVRPHIMVSRGFADYGV